MTSGLCGETRPRRCVETPQQPAPVRPTGSPWWGSGHELWSEEPQKGRPRWAGPGLKRGRKNTFYPHKKGSSGVSEGGRGGPRRDPQERDPQERDRPAHPPRFWRKHGPNSEFNGNILLALRARRSRRRSGDPRSKRLLPPSSPGK